MTDTASKQQLVTTTEPRMIVQSTVPIFDTAHFAQTMEVAHVLAKASFTPDSFKGYWKGQGQSRTFQWFDDDVVVANCFLVADQARGWNMNAFQVIQCCSMVQGKLMHEGKLIAAVIQAMLGYDLEYEFTPAPADAPRKLKVTVSATDREGKLVVDSKGRAKTISGTVDGWHTGEKGPWNKTDAWERQLRYRGAREWVRAYAPAAILGVIGDDEMDERREDLRAAAALPVSGGLMQRLAQAGAAGADIEGHVRAELGDRPAPVDGAAADGDEDDQTQAGDGAAQETTAAAPRAVVGESAPAATDRTGQDSSEALVGSDEGAADPAPAEAKAAEKASQQPAGAVAEDEAAPAAPAQKNAPTARAKAAAKPKDEPPPAEADEPEWLADLTEDQRAVYDRVTDGLARVTGKTWIKFSGIWRSELRALVEALPAEPRRHLEDMMAAKREQLGV